MSDHERHEALKSQAGHHLQGKMSLASTLAYYRDKSRESAPGSRDRRLWKQLADELEARIESTKPVTVAELEQANETIF